MVSSSAHSSSTSWVARAVLWLCLAFLSLALRLAACIHRFRHRKCRDAEVQAALYFCTRLPRLMSRDKLLGIHPTASRRSSTSSATPTPLERRRSDDGRTLSGRRRAGSTTPSSASRAAAPNAPLPLCSLESITPYTQAWMQTTSSTAPRNRLTIVWITLPEDFEEEAHAFLTQVATTAGADVVVVKLLDFEEEGVDGSLHRVVRELKDVRSNVRIGDAIVLAGASLSGTIAMLFSELAAAAHPLSDGDSSSVFALPQPLAGVFVVDPFVGWGSRFDGGGSSSGTTPSTTPRAPSYHNSLATTVDALGTASTDHGDLLHESVQSLLDNFTQRRIRSVFPSVIHGSGGVGGGNGCAPPMFMRLHRDEGLWFTEALRFALRASESMADVTVDLCGSQAPMFPEGEKSAQQPPSSAKASLQTDSWGRLSLWVAGLSHERKLLDESFGTPNVRSGFCPLTRTPKKGGPNPSSTGRPSWRSPTLSGRSGSIPEELDSLSPLGTSLAAASNVYSSAVPSRVVMAGATVRPQPNTTAFAGAYPFHRRATPPTTSPVVGAPLQGLPLVLSGSSIASIRSSPVVPESPGQSL